MEPYIITMTITFLLIIGLIITIFMLHEKFVPGCDLNHCNKSIHAITNPELPVDMF